MGVSLLTAFGQQCSWEAVKAVSFAFFEYDVDCQSGGE